MLKIEDKFKILSAYLPESIFHSIKQFIDKLSRQDQGKLSRMLVVSIELIHSSLSNNDADSFYLSYLYLRTELCKRVSYQTAYGQILLFNKLVQFMIKEGIFTSGSITSLSALSNCIFNKSLYEASKMEKIPDDVLKKINHKPEALIEGNEKQVSVEVNKRLDHLATVLNSNIDTLLRNFIAKSSTQCQLRLTFIFIECAQLLSAPLNNSNTNELTKNITYIASYLCKKHTALTTNSIYIELRTFIQYLINTNYLKDESTNKLNALLLPISDIEYENLKNLVIPEEIKNKFTPKPTAEKVFNDTLKKCCTPEIAQRLREHVNSFKIKKHHRAPLVQFIEQIYKAAKNWHEEPKIIQGEMLKFRGDLLNEKQRNSAYGNFQNVKNAFSVLSNQGLLPSHLQLPNNLRRCTSTEKIRTNNPLIIEVDMYDERTKDSYINTSEFLEHLKDDLSNNLNILIKEAQNIVYEGYRKFKAKNDVIAKSQFHEFIHHPNLLTSNCREIPPKINKKVNPFNTDNPLRSENLTAYYNYYFDALVKNEKPHCKAGLVLSNKFIGYLGLTMNVASAMQIIITKELGINPYSLYRVKISSDAQGREFVQVDDEGSVRLKALKPRARNARTRKAVSSTAQLDKINTSEIDAATCLKMALEMTSRIRESLGVKELWLCISLKGATISQISGFQKEFKKISEKASSKSHAIKYATLKKVRTSKGVLIYLESNGNSIKTANYLGNTVKTTLNRYIPRYLTELIFRVKIRNFQKIFLFMSIASDDSPTNSLNMSQNNFKTEIELAFKNPDMGGNLFNKLGKSSNNDVVYFCLSDTNLKLAIAYAKNGDNKQLRENCRNVINKVAEGPIIMKQMLRKAQIAVDS